MLTRLWSDPGTTAPLKAPPGHLPLVRLQASATFLVLWLALAQGVLLHPSQVKPMQDILNAAGFGYVNVTTVCDGYSEDGITLACNKKGFPTILYLQAVMSTLPDSISALAELTSLGASGGIINGTLPASLGSLPKLEELSFFAVEMTSPIPAPLGDIRALQTLSFTAMSLVGFIPSELGKLSALTDLSLSSNKLVGPIPNSLRNLKNLKLL